MEANETEKILNDAVLVFLVKDGKVLLATKTKKIGKGKLNAHGGGIEPGETPSVAGARELEEETRGDREVGVIVDPNHLEKVAIMHFRNTTEGGITFVCKVHCFIAKDWQGEIISTDDMANPEWFPIDNIPLDQMMLADRIWLPIMLSGKKIEGYATYGPRQETLINDVEIEYINNF